MEVAKALLIISSLLTGSITLADPPSARQKFEITRQIRKSLMENKNLSRKARNVKITTTEKEVVLKGPVSSEKERIFVEGAAKKVAGSYNIVNQTFVK